MHLVIYNVVMIHQARELARSSVEARSFRILWFQIPHIAASMSTRYLENGNMAVSTTWRSASWVFYSSCGSY